MVPSATPRDLALVFLYTRATRYAVNALLGAAESRPRLAAMPLRLAEHETHLAGAVAAAAAEHPERLVVVGISFTSVRRTEVARLVHRLRTENAAREANSEAGRGGIFVVGGGAHASADPADALGLGFDAVVRGEGEATFADLLECLLDGRDWRGLPGIACRDEAGQAVLTAPAPPVDIDALRPFPFERGMAGHVEITRGCPFACGFCQISRLHGTRPRHRSVARVAEAVAALRRVHRTDFRFISPNAFGYGSPDGREPRPQAVAELLAAVRDAAGPASRVYLGTFPSEVRPEFVSGELVDLVRRTCDNDNLVLGAQSGSDALLRRCHRGHTVDDVRRAVACIRRVGLGANVDFIFGLPGETDADRAATLDFMDELVTMGARIHAHTFMPVPQTLFAGAPPGRIHESVRERLFGRLVPRGQAYGNWREQEAHAASIASLAR